jgi:hypothetical protein
MHSAKYIGPCSAVEALNLHKFTDIKLNSVLNDLLPPVVCEYWHFYWDLPKSAEEKDKKVLGIEGQVAH